MTSYHSQGRSSLANHSTVEMATTTTTTTTTRRDNNTTPTTAKLTKSRRTAVKPILKKLHSHSHSEHNSLDLERSWWETTNTTPPVGLGAFDYSAANSSSGINEDDLTTTSSLYRSDHSTNALGFTLGDASSGAAATAGGGGSSSRTPRDVSFTFSPDMVNTTSSASTPSRGRLTHGRSHSGASHVSVASSTSGRNGSFVHPFQQTPMASTPPLSYANSLVSLDNARDYSPTINEDDGDVDPLSAVPPTTTSRTFHPHTSPLLSQSISQSQSQSPHFHHTYRASFANKRTVSMSDVTQAPRILSRRSNSNQIPSTSYGASDLSSRDLQRMPADLPLPSPTTASPSPEIAPTPPSSSFSQHISPLRTSLEKGAFRIRSRSEVDTMTRQEQVREARRKFEEKEKAKEEKYAREQERKLERPQCQGRKGSLPIVGGRSSSSTDPRPSTSRKSTGTSGQAAAAAAAAAEEAEKSNLTSLDYDRTTAGQAPEPRAEGVRFNTPKRKAAKRKTRSAWISFMIRLRTWLLNLGRK